MSQNKETAFEGSEDLFTTQDLLPESQSAQVASEQTVENIEMTDINKDIGDNNPNSNVNIEPQKEPVAESENIELTTEDIQQTKDDTEAMVEDCEQIEIS